MASAYDPEDRKVLSYRIADTMTTQLATSVIVKALRRGEKTLYVHSDMGSQYTSELFENTLKSIGILGTLTPVKGTITIMPASKVFTRYSSGS